MALIAVLKYTYESKILGKTLLELLSEPHAKSVKDIFLNLAEAYSPIVEPQTSWDLIASRNGELRSSVMQFRAGDVNKAFSDLTLEETESLLNSYIGYLSKEKR